MKKSEFVKSFESVLRNANVDVVNLDLIDDEHVEITYKGGGKRKINIAGRISKGLAWSLPICRQRRLSALSPYNCFLFGIESRDRRSMTVWSCSLLFLR